MDIKTLILIKPKKFTTGKKGGAIKPSSLRQCNKKFSVADFHQYSCKQIPFLSFTVIPPNRSDNVLGHKNRIKAPKVSYSTQPSHSHVKKKL